jgi:transposase
VGGREAQLRRAGGSGGAGVLSLPQFDDHPLSGVLAPEGCPIMESVGKKPWRRRAFTPEFKVEIELCRRGDRSISQVARDFDMTETAVREWVKQAERDAGTRGDGGLTSDERRELAELRRENRRLKEDVEILERATAFVEPGPL